MVGTLQRARVAFQALSYFGRGRILRFQRDAGVKFGWSATAFDHLSCNFDLSDAAIQGAMLSIFSSGFGAARTNNFTVSSGFCSDL